MDKKRPIGITLIGYFYILGAIALIVTLFTNATQQFGIAVRFGMPNVPENIMRASVVVVFLLMSYGYLRLQKWGYWFMIIYTVYFLVVSICLSQQYKNQLFYGNAIFSIVVLIYTLSQRKYFSKVKFSS
ncbi:hypothetical protein [Clostridium akagii]|uniref:hypothetical protein n=1 Tax=Clostridium akagii TaxID=91623 RepID=UPI000479CB10|nr:hypothetical protein [Clostridium akagii]